MHLPPPIIPIVVVPVTCMSLGVVLTKQHRADRVRAYNGQLKAHIHWFTALCKRTLHAWHGRAARSSEVR